MAVHPQDARRRAVAPTRVGPTALALAVALTLAAPLAADAADALRVVRDAATGELRGPTAAEVAAFERAEAQLRQQNPQPAVKGPTEIVHPDGSIETKLGEDTTLYSVVRANEDGTLSMACLPAKQAKAFVKGAKPAAKAKAKAVSQIKPSHNHD